MKSSAQSAPIDSPFLSRFHGSLTSALRWHQLDALWDILRARADAGWYLYAIGETPPAAPASAERVLTFISEIDALLRKEHEEDYCGVVYANDLEQPALVKIYDPNNLGVSCGFSTNPPLPGWVMSLDAPVDVAAMRQAANRRRWWQKIFE